MDTDLEIFLQAPGNPSLEELARYLDDACGGDKHLRSRVEALFVADGVEEGIVDQAPRISDSSAPLEAEGNIIHNYKLLQKIGEGGFTPLSPPCMTPNPGFHDPSAKSKSLARIDHRKMSY
ncbi:MAG: hypothetical protein P1U90_14050 [Akkermansiaceae bacterium]|nr:hypothetical protein [Akkermansiaceae bacterium]